MNYVDLKDGQRVYMYVPSMDTFYRMDVTLRHDKTGSFVISNYDANKKGLIGGHFYLAVIQNQEDIDNFFYLQAGPVREKDFDTAESHFKKNGKSWIFGSINTVGLKKCL